MSRRSIAPLLALALALFTAASLPAASPASPRAVAVLRGGEAPVVVLSTGSGWTLATGTAETGRFFVTFADERLVVLGDTSTGLPHEVRVTPEPVPLDVLTAAVCRCAGVDLVLVGAPPSEPMAWTPSGGDAVDEMAALWEALGRVVSRRPGLLVVGERAIPETLPPGGTRALDFIDASSLAVVEALERWARTTLIHDEQGVPVTVSCRRLGLRALALCLDGAGGLHIRRATPAAARRASPASPLATARALARRGDLARARRVLEAELRAGRGSASHLVLLSRICWRQGQRRRALTVLEHAVARGGAPEAGRVAQRMRAVLAGELRS